MNGVLMVVGVFLLGEGGERVRVILGVLERESKKSVGKREREREREKEGEKGGVGFTPKGHALGTFKLQNGILIAFFLGGVLLFIVKHKL